MRGVRQAMPCGPDYPVRPDISRRDSPQIPEQVRTHRRGELAVAQPLDDGVVPVITTWAAAASVPRCYMHHSEQGSLVRT